MESGDKLLTKSLLVDKVGFTITHIYLPPRRETASRGDHSVHQDQLETKLDWDPSQQEIWKQNPKMKTVAEIGVIKTVTNTEMLDSHQRNWRRHNVDKKVIRIKILIL